MSAALARVPSVTVEAWIDRTLGIPAGLQSRILGTIAVLIVYAFVARVVRRVGARAVTDAANRYKVATVTSYVLGVLTFLALVRVWVQDVAGLATYLGLVSAGVAIALSDLITNFVGWIFILVRRPFEVGDRIQIGNQLSGDVVDIRLFMSVVLEIGNWVHADQSTGRVVYVPNGLVFKNTIANYDKGFSYIWNEIEVVVTFESNWKKAKEVLLRTVADHAEHLTADALSQINEAADRYHMKFAKLTPMVWTSAVDSGVRLTLRYLCKPRERRSSTSEMWESILDALAELPDVDLAYPTTRYFENATEGKPGCVPPKATSISRPSST